MRVCHDVGPQYTVEGGVVLNAATLRLDAADVTCCARWARNPSKNPATEKGYYDWRRASVNKMHIKVGVCALAPVALCTNPNHCIT